ncbi:TPA: ead/Ea22-like family protein [Enterobacter hormaechei]|nr:ead/Ea22-like family protein [Enterobacter hormaechei]
MSNIDKQALRINAQLASSGKWIKESGDGWEAICSSDDQANAGFIVAHFEGPDAKENREFIQAASPATVLALLDELEAAERRNAELTKALEQTVSGYKSCLRTGHERILDLGGDCDAPEVMIAGNTDIRQAEKLLAAAAGKGEAS